MKKSLFIFILVGLLCLSACGTPKDNTPTKPVDTSAADTKPTATQPESTPTEPTVFEPQPGYFPIPEEPATFTFLSGAGGWWTEMDINTDGTFSGRYQDGEMGASGEGYQATYYVCDFSGVFADVEKVDQNTYKVRLASISTIEPIGKEWIDKEIRYIAAAPHGLYDYDKKQNCEEFIVYMPTTPVSELSEEFLSWWPYKGENKDTLECFGLMNVTTQHGFFYTPEA